MKLETYKRILGKDFKLNNTKIYWVYEDDNIRISTKNNDINNIEFIKFTVNKKDSTGKFKTIWKGLIPDVSFLEKIIKYSTVD